MTCPICQCQFGDSDCVHFIGSGQPDGPYRPQVRVRSSSNEMVQCGPKGLGVFLPLPWANIPTVRVVATVPQTLIPGAQQVVFMNNTVYDTNSMHDPKDNSSRITFNTSGLYNVTLSFTTVKVTDPVTTSIYGRVRLNGFQTIGEDRAENFANVIGPYAVTVTLQREFQVGNYIEGMAELPSAGDANAGESATIQPSPPPTFTATFLRELP